MGELAARVLPSDRALYIEQDIVITSIHRYLGQVVDLGLHKVLSQHRAAESEYAHLSGIQSCIVQFAITHAAYTRLAHAYFHPVTVGEHRFVSITVDTCYHRQAQYAQ